MRFSLPSLALAALVAAAPVAVADTARMSDADFMRASHCLAYLTAQEVPDAVTDPLESEVRRQSRQREPHITDGLRADARSISRQWRRADTDAERLTFANAQAQACAGFEALTAGAPGQGSGGL